MIRPRPSGHPGRSEWDEATAEEVSDDFERVKHSFEAANAQLS